MKVEISIPESLNEVTLEQYQRFLAIDKNANEDYLSRKMLEIFCGVTDTLKVKKKDVDKVARRLEALLNQRYPLVPQFTIDDVTYGFIPSLDEITFGEYIDLDNLLSWKDMHRAMAILYRPITKKHKNLYEIEEYESSLKYSEAMKKAPASVAVGAVVFFWTLSNELIELFQRYLKNQKEKKQDTITSPQAKLQPSTDGLQHSIDLLAETLQSRKQLPDCQLANVFIHYLTSQRETERKP